MKSHPDNTTPLRRALDAEERSCAWLGRRVGVHRMTALRWADGLHEPDQETKLRVAAALRRDVSVLWPDDADAEPLKAAA